MAYYEGIHAIRGLFTHPFYYIEYDIAQISAFEFTDGQETITARHGRITRIYVMREEA
jgi:hypothetical protein